QVLVERALVGVLEPAPAADVVHQDRLVVSPVVLDVVDDGPEPVSAGDVQPTAALVGVGADDLEPAAAGVLADRVLVVGGGVLLMLRGHADVLRRPHARGLRYRGGRRGVVVCHGGRRGGGR